MASGKKKKGQRKEEEDSNVKNAADTIPENSREIVQTMKEIVDFSEQEIYAMLVECNMDPHEAITRLLSQDSFQEVKSKRNKKKEDKEKSRDEDSNENADKVPADSREVVENEKEILNCSEQETCTRHVDCNMDADKAVNRLLSQDTSNVQGIHNHLAGSSTTAGILGSGPPSNSDVLDVATKRVPISSYRLISGQRTMADVVKMSLASSKESVAKGAVEDDCHLTERPDESAARRDQRRESTSISNQNFREDNHGGSRLLSDSYNNKNDETVQVQRETFEHNQTKDPPASVDTNLQELSIENDEPEASVKNLQHLRFGSFGSGMNGSGQPSSLPSEFLNNDDSEDISDSADPPVSVLTSLQQLSTENDEPEASIKESQHLRFDRFGFGMNSGLPSEFLNDDDYQFSYQNTRDGECHEEEENQLWSIVADDQTEPTQENQYESSSSATDNSQLFNPMVAPIRLQMQNVNTFPYMRPQAYTREPDPQAYPLNQSTPTASSLEALLIAPISEPQMNRQAMNHPYSQPMVLSGNDGNMMNYPYSQPTQNDTYNMSPSAFQQHGGHNNNSNHLGSSFAPLSRYRNSDLSSIAYGPTNGSAYGSTNGSAYSSTNGSAYGSTNGSAYGPTNGSAYGSTNGSAYNSAYGFGMASDNAANSRYGYEDFSQVSRHFPSFEYQNGNTNIWTFQGLNDSGSNYYSLNSDHQNQQSQSVRHSQQQQLQQEQEQLYRRGIGYGTTEADVTMHLQTNKTMEEETHLTKHNNSNNGQETTTNQNQPIKAYTFFSDTFYFDDFL